VPLFTFDLRPTLDIAPWGEPGALSLSWFALTDGEFRIETVQEVLFREPDYQVAAYARGTLWTMASALAPLPRFFEELVCNRALLVDLYQRSWPTDRSFDERAYTAWRWLGERTPDFPEKMAFIRVGSDVHVLNTTWRGGLDEEGTSKLGSYVLAVDDFALECRDLGDRLIAAMGSRIAGIGAGAQRTQIALDVDDLWKQQAGWRAEFDSYVSRSHVPDIDAKDAEAALRSIASDHGIVLSSA
jgi:hypothetical protein